MSERRPGPIGRARRRRLSALRLLVLILLLGVAAWLLATAAAPGETVVPGRGEAGSGSRPVAHPGGGPGREVPVRDGERVAAGALLVRPDDGALRAGAWRLSDTAPGDRIGWRLTSAVAKDPGFEAGLDAMRKAAVGGTAPRKHGVMSRGTIRR